MRCLPICILTVLSLVIGCGEEEPAEPAGGVRIIELVVEPPPRLDLPVHLRGALHGRRVVILVGDFFYDPELYDVRRLFLEAGARVFLASDYIHVAGTGGSVPLLDLQLEELARRDDIDLLYLMQSKGMEGMANFPATGTVIGNVLDDGGYVGASGIGALALLQNGRAHGVRMAVFKGQRKRMRRGGAVIVEEDDVVLDGRIGTCEFWPQGPRLALALIENLAVES
ncbi:DJ-1/PfpI family protein [bacterium]|nr:DJ-1/PfpI family protein [bacterium]